MEKLQVILEKLAVPIPKSYYQIKKKGGARIDYVAWYDLVDLLDERAPGWEYHVDPLCYPHHWIQVKEDRNKTVQEIERHGLMIVCKGSITIHGSDGSITREAIGYQDPEEAYIGDEATNAEATCLRRACAKLGLGRDMWRKEDRPQQEQQSRPQNSKPAAQKKDEKPLTPEQMEALLRNMLEESYEKGGAALQKAIEAASKRLSKFPAKNRKSVKEMISGYEERLQEFEVENQ